MKMRSVTLLLAVVLALWSGGSTAIAQETSVTVGAGGIFPAGTTFNGVPLNGLQSGYGVEIGATGSALGQFCTTLIGVSLTGAPVNIVVEGKATGGTRTAANIATFSGTCSINMGDGTPPLVGVPFNATIATNANDQGSIGLILGQTTLPAATVNQGSMTIK
jgi:hypothetical protein